MVLVIPLVLVAMISAIVGNVMQFGMQFSPESIKPDIKKISPIGGLKKIFALKNLVEFFKSVIKIIFLSCCGLLTLSTPALAIWLIFHIAAVPAYCRWSVY